MTQENTFRKQTKAGKRQCVARAVRCVFVAAMAALVMALGVAPLSGCSSSSQPSTAAAKYAEGKYIDEQEVTDYIMTYKEQMGYGDAPDEQWAEFLATYNLTPERLRYTTIVQLTEEKRIQEKCDELGITATDEEIDATIETLKTSLGLTDESVFEQTLAQYGQTLEGLREVYREQLLKTKLCSQEVETPTPTDDQVKAMVKSYAQSAATSSDEYLDYGTIPATVQLKHSYCFGAKWAGSTGTYEEEQNVQIAKDQLVEYGLNLSNFQLLLQEYCDVDDLKSVNGDMGWNADTSEYSEEYLRELENTAVGGVSNVFGDYGAYCFIWVDQAVDLPTDDASYDSYDVNSLPSGLRSYFSDVAAYQLWLSAGDEYVANLVDESQFEIYTMPTDVPYNVDMSPYVSEDGVNMSVNTNTDGSSANTNANANANETAATENKNTNGTNS